MPASGDMLPIPTSANQEDRPLNFGPLNLSIRQLTSTMLFGVGWYILGAEIMGAVIPLWLGLLICIPMPIFGFWIGFVTKDKFPYEYYLANKLIYFMDGEYYTLRAADYDEIQSAEPEKMEGYY